MSKKRPLPKTCLLTVSNKCHLHCKMCDLWKKDTGEEELTIDECKRFISSLNALGSEPVEVHLIGGETLAKDGIFDLISYIHGYGSRVVITTSGYPITEQCAKEIAASGLDMINFSLESLDSSVHDYLRGSQGLVDKVFRAIEYVAEYAPAVRLGINTIITKQNLQSIEPLCTWVGQHDKLSSLYFMAVMRPFGSDLDFNWYSSERAQLLWPSNYAEVERILNVLIELKRSNSSKIENSIGQFNAYKNYFRNPIEFIKAEGCSLSDHAININAIGDAYLCFFMEKLGNIKEQSAEALWFSETADNIREKMKRCRQNCELVVNCYYEDEQ